MKYLYESSKTLGYLYTILYLIEKFGIHDAFFIDFFDFNIYLGYVPSLPIYRIAKSTFFT